MLIAVAFAAAAWVVVLLWMGMAIGTALGALLGAVAGKGTETPWWLEAGPALATMAIVFAAQLGLTSVTVRRIGRPNPPVFGHFPGLLLAVLLGPLPFGALVSVEHRAAARREAELNDYVAAERAEDQRRAEHAAETAAARQHRDDLERARQEEGR